MRITTERNGNDFLRVRLHADERNQFGPFDALAAACFAASIPTGGMSLLHVFPAWIVITFARLWYFRQYDIKEEGVQISRSNGTIECFNVSGPRDALTVTSRRDLERSSLVINEGVTRQTVVTYLAVAVRGEDKLTVVCWNLQPPLRELMSVYNIVQGFIDETGATDVPKS